MNAALGLVFCRVVLGLVFAISCGAKLRDVRAFAHTIGLFAPLPRRLTLPAAWLLLSLELGIVLALATGGPLLAPGFVGAAALLLAFSGALARVLLRKRSVSCSCFGASRRPVVPADIWRNGGLICCALGGYQATRATSGLAPRLAALDMALIGLAALAFVAIWLHIAEIVQLFRPG
jgi:hypothetical protein